VSWVGFNPKDSVPIKALETIGSTVEAVAGTVTGTLEVVKTILEIVSKLLLSVPDLEATALQLAIEAVRAILKDLVSDAGCYYLPIPIRFSTIIPPETILFDPTPGGGAVADEANLFLPPVGGGDGGNYGFMQDVINSLNDTDDLMRPQFDTDAHVAGLVVLAGSDSYLKLVDLVDQFRKLFTGMSNSGAGEGMAIYTIPKLRNLSAEIIGAAVGQQKKMKNRVYGDSAVHPYGIRLSWDHNDHTTVFSNDEVRLVFVIRNIVVYRSKRLIDPAMDADDLAALQIASFEYDGLVTDFFDDTIELDQRYYYAVGYEIEAAITRGPGSPSSVTFPATRDPTFTYTDIPEHINMLPRSGTPPDWLLLPNPFALIPDIEEVVTSVNVFLDSLEKRTATAESKFQAYIDALNAEIQRYATLVQRMISLINRIVKLLTFPDVYVGAYTFSGKGGNNFFVNSLGSSLQDPNDPERPPFDRGDEIVTGFVLYTGSATAGKVEKFTNAINLLLETEAATVASIYAQAAAELGIVLEAVERDICFLDDLTKADVCEDDEPVNTTLGSDLDEDEEDPGCLED